MRTNDLVGWLESIREDTWLSDIDSDAFYSLDYAAYCQFRELCEELIETAGDAVRHLQAVKARREQQRKADGDA